jgi:hypothetical protein
MTAQELARSKPAEVAEIEKQRAPLEHEVHVKPGIFEGIVDKRRIKVTRHGAARISARRGDALRSRKDARRVCEVKIVVKALNRMLELGRGICVRVA